MRDIGLDYVALCPGSSFRGLHESLVNHLGNARPEMLFCLHEEHAVAIAHGYARVTGKPMGVIVHCNVGVMHASMAIYNAWCDRMPIVILGGVGPLNSARRRTPIDWLHSAADQGNLVRNYVKWDDQPHRPRLRWSRSCAAIKSRARRLRPRSLSRSISGCRKTASLTRGEASRMCSDFRARIAGARSGTRR